jgi:nitrite reductase/ring-hydroxylating ferredoxin subunit
VGTSSSLHAKGRHLARGEQHPPCQRHVRAAPAEIQDNVSQWNPRRIKVKGAPRSHRRERVDQPLLSHRNVDAAGDIQPLRSIRGMSAEFITTGLATADIPPGGLAVAAVRGTKIAVANVGGTYYAFDDTCTHEQCSLAEGDLAGTTVTCMCHGAEFDVRTGAVLAPPAPAPVRVYRVRVEGGALQVEI